MPGRDAEPSSLLEYFAGELRRFRVAAGMSQGQLAQRLNYSTSLVAMLETARRVPQSDFAARADEVLATGGVLARLAPLVRQEAYPRWFRPFVELEAEAVSIREWEPLVVPGLVQTADYARALITAYQPGESEEAVAEQVTARLERGKILDRADPPLLWLVVYEAALRCPVGSPRVLRDQLTHLLDVTASHPKVIVQVVPFRAGANPGLTGPITILSRRRKPDIVYLEAQGNAQVFDQPDDVARYALRYDMLRAVALAPEPSRELIADLAKEE